MSNLSNKIVSISLFLGLCFAPVELHAQDTQEEEQMTESTSTLEIHTTLAFAASHSMREHLRVAIYHFLVSLFNESKNETANPTQEYETIGIPGLSAIWVVGVLFTTRVKKQQANRNDISAAQTKLSHYLALAPDEQRDFLLANLTAPFDFAPAFRSQQAMTNFILSPGVQNLNHDGIVALFNHKDKSGQTFFGVFVDPRIVMEQDFFRCLTKDMQRDTIFLASPVATTIKKILFVSLDLCRNLALMKLLKVKVQAAHPVTNAEEQAEAFFRVFEENTQRVISPVVRPVLLNHLAPVTYKWQLGWLGVLGSSVERTVEASDDIIVSTYGEGAIGFVKASAQIILLPFQFSGKGL